MKPRRLPLKRTELRNRTELKRTTRLSSSGPIKAKKPRQSVEETDARELLAKRSKGWCEIQAPDVCQGQAREWSHRKAKGHCKPEELWALTNGLHACGHGNLDGCHGLVHQQPDMARGNGWMVRSSLKPAAIPARRRGVLVWLLPNGRAVPLDMQEIAEWVGAA